MKHFSNKINGQLLYSIEKIIRDLKRISVFLFLSLLLMQPGTENLWITKSISRKKIQPTNNHEKNFGSEKYSREKISNSLNTHEKNIPDPQNIHEKKN